MAEVDVEFPVSILGERGDIPDNELPIQALRLCQNMVRSPRTGRLDIRPGYKKLTANGPGGRIVGIVSFKSAAGDDILVAANQTGWAKISGNSWTDITGTALTGQPTDLVRFQVFPVSGVYNAIGVNGVDTNKIWDGFAATYSDMDGSPPVAIDVASAANRVLLLVSPDNVRISEFNDPGTWRSTGGFNVHLPDVGDLLIGMARMNRTTVGIFGERSQWIAQAQSGSAPFAFQKVSEQIGPISKASAVNVGGVIYYLGIDGIVYRYDGTPAVEISRAMQKYVNDNLGYFNRAAAHAFFVHFLGKIFFLFPTENSSAPIRGVYFDPRTREMGRLAFANGVTASSAWAPIPTGLSYADLLPYTYDNIANTYPTYQSLSGEAIIRELVGDTSGFVHGYGLGPGGDDGVAIDAIWESPLKAYAGWSKSFVAETAETFFRQASASTTVTVSVGHTDTLMADPILEEVDDFDISVDRRTDVDISKISEKRFINVRHAVSTATGDVSWQGCILHGESTEVARGPTNEI